MLKFLVPGYGYTCINTWCSRSRFYATRVPGHPGHLSHIQLYPGTRIGIAVPGYRGDRVPGYPYWKF
eukprot:271062-Rhodomonas_salina.1